MNTDMSRQKLFAGLVEQALSASRQLLALLQTEFEVLSGNSADVLEKIVQEKKTHLIKISQVMAEQEALLASMGLGNDRAGVEQLYAGLPADHGWVQQWQKLRQLARLLSENNLRNGVMLSQRMDTTRKSLDILTHQPSSADSYQYAGKAESYRQSKSLAYA